MNKLREEQEFDLKGNYTFCFEYQDKDGVVLYKTMNVNDHVPQDIAYDIARKYVKEFRGRITWFVDNETAKILNEYSQKQLAKLYIKKISNILIFCRDFQVDGNKQVFEILEKEIENLKIKHNL